MEYFDRRLISSFFMKRTICFAKNREVGYNSNEMMI